MNFLCQGNEHWEIRLGIRESEFYGGLFNFINFIKIKFARVIIYGWLYVCFYAVDLDYFIQNCC